MATETPKGEHVTPPRPRAPHLQVWHWHVTMATSIFHRATGVALYVGSILAALWVFAIAAGPQYYTPLANLFSTWPGQIILFLWTIALSFHMINGVRHLIWDNGQGFKPKTADQTGWFAILSSIIVATAIWAVAAFY